VAFVSPQTAVEAVEVIEWTPRWGFSGASANFARLQILLTVFDGDPDKWLDAIVRWGNKGDDSDVPFLAAMKQRLAHDSTFLDDMRGIMHDFAERFGTLKA
jgi:hypothetical protein